MREMISTPSPPSRSHWISRSPPPEAQTEAEKIAYCAGWWAAVEQKREQPEQENFPEEKLQAVAEYFGDKYHVWYGIGARDVEEVLCQSVRRGLVTLNFDTGEQPAQAEPVAFADQISFDQTMKSGKGHDVWPKAGDYEARTGRKLRALYTHPPRQWQSLSEEEISRAYFASASHTEYARAVEQALRSKNHD
jgi:hypothetical protein